MFERYVNFELHQTDNKDTVKVKLFERYVNFELHQTQILL